MARLALVLAGCAATASAFAPAGMAGLRLKSAAAVSRRPAATAPKMALEGIEGAAQLFAVAQNVPFVDEVTGEAQGFTAPVNHFASVSFFLHALLLHRATAFRAQPAHDALVRFNLSLDGCVKMATADGAAPAARCISATAILVFSLDIRTRGLCDRV